MVENFCAGLVGVESYVVADCVGWEEAVDSAGGDEFLFDDDVEELVAVFEYLARFDALTLVVEDASARTIFKLMATVVLTSTSSTCGWKPATVTVM